MKTVTLLDVDNTLLDNDAAKDALERRILAAVSEERAARFWSLYEDVRRERGVVDFPETLRRFHAIHPDASDRVDRAVLDMPYDRFLYPGALDAIAHLATLGTPVILSDGDRRYQPRKIERSGLAAAVRGNVIVTDHKEERLDEVLRRFPADHYVLIDDKAAILAEVKRRLDGRVTTVHVLQGHYAGEPPDGPAPDVVVQRIGDLADLPADRLVP
ncbi:MAG: HAD family hydrolase [Chloroflexi bacterium]|nr:MAG: hypothetical protein AUI58_07960 [Chloroflexi bacterium 13_1_40CM_2_70_6]TME93285.1 MAG: HAD family hydrolase [Chloroflexota bacterium]TMG33991.1 MAG: HAD family hydrolase [Chloroflexota bacterium]